jgi:LacI family transcriptional regulator
MPKSATQHDIAKLAGVSHMTVSRALRGHPDVQKATRQRIMQLAERHGYRVNRSARAMRQGSYGALGLLMSQNNAASALLPGFVAGIRRAMRERGLHLVLGEVPDEEMAGTDRLPRLLQEWSVDGLIVHYTHDAPDALAKTLRRYRLPAVWTNTHRAHHCVVPDDHAAAAELAERAWAMGHREAMYLDVINSHHPSVPARRDGFVGRFKQLGGKVRIRIVEPTPADEVTPSVHEWLDQTWQKLAPATFVAAYRPVDAQRMIHVAARHGVQVPEALSVTSFFTRRELYAGLVELSGYQVPAEQLGEEAVQMLCRRIDDAAEPEREAEPIPARRLPLRWLVGQTVGPRAGHAAAVVGGETA